MVNPTSSAFSQFVKIQNDDIVVSSEDKRSYKAIELNNGMKILLISDPTTDKSAASLAINVGHMLDPREMPGLAHFCEHMLFMGTEKYPVENDYQKFLTTHGGSSNAQTTNEHTVYYFDVAPEHLNAAIDRFSQFFISPLFTPSATEREVNAVDSEHSNNVQDDGSRFVQLHNSLSNPTHDYSKFGTGNRKTLWDDAKAQNLDPREELLKFHKNHYSSNLMALSVLGKESLDELMALIVPMFSAIENKNLPTPTWNTHPYGAEQVGRRINMVPVMDSRNLYVYFPIPDLRAHYKSCPGEYLGHLIGHEGQGGILSELKNRGWVNGLTAGPTTMARGFGFFIISMDLSVEGLEHVDDIMVLIFKYIKMLKDVGPHEWIHREIEDIKKLRFRFKNKQNPRPCVVTLSQFLHRFPLDEVLCARYMIPDYKPQLIVDILEMLAPENCCFFVLSKCFRNKTDKKEQWYGTSYSTEKIPSILLDRCHGSKIEADFKLPDKNDFIPTRFDLYPRDIKNNKQQPELIFHDPMIRLWYKQDDEFLMPKCCVFLHMKNPLVYSDPQNSALTDLYIYMLGDALTEYAYNAQLSKLKYYVESGRYGITLYVCGFNEKLAMFLEKIVEKMSSYKPDPKRFEILKEYYVRELKNFDMAQPYEQAKYYSFVVLSHCWPVDEILRKAETLTLDNVTDFVQRFFSNLHIDAYVHGNTDRNNCRKLIDTTVETIKRFANVKPLFRSQLVKDREVHLPDGTFHTFSLENETHSNSALEFILQTTLENTNENMLNQLLTQIMHEPCFDQLRTKEQLGYIVINAVRCSRGTWALKFVVQGDKTPDFVDYRIEEFLVQMEKTIQDMNLEEFEKHKAALAVDRLEKPKNLSALANTYWDEIYHEHYHFNRDKVEVDAMKKFTKDDILNFFKKMISRDAPQRRKLSVYVYSLEANASGFTRTDNKEGSFFNCSIRIHQSATVFNAVFNGTIDFE